MNHLYRAIKTICTLEELALQSSWLNHLHPLTKLLVTFGYILTVTSLHKYELLPLLELFCYPIALFFLSGLNFFQAVAKLKIIFILALFIGISNPFFDTTPISKIFGITITGGMISFVTFALKGILTITASYLLIASTTMKGVCTALKVLRVPTFFLTQLLLMYRYIIVVLHTVSDMQDSYVLRSHSKRGIAPKHWGTFAGQLLLHSLHRGEQLYQSMQLRGYTPESFYISKQKFTKVDLFYLLVWFCFFIYVKSQ